MNEPTIKTTLQVTLATLVLLLGSSAFAQWGTSDWDAYMAQHNAQVDAWMAQRYAQIDAQRQESQTWFIGYYREATGDYRTPDVLAFEYGINLYCERNAAECREVYGTHSAASASAHEARMRDIQSWGEVSAGIAASNASILDASHQGFLDRSRMQDQGHANLIQGAVQGQWNYGNPSTGAYWNLPVMPDPYTQYRTPEGQPLAFDFQTGVWYVGTQGGWTPLQPRR